MSLSLTNESKPNKSNKWSERALTWATTGPAHDIWAIPGSAFTNETKISLSISNEAKLGNNLRTWDDYTIAYDDSLPDTWDTQSQMALTNESKT